MKEHGFELVSLEPASGRGFDMHTLRLGRDGDTEPLTADATFHKPNELGKNAAWFHMQDRLHRSGFGYWTDMLAVATGELDFAKF